MPWTTSEHGPASPLALSYRVYLDSTDMLMFTCTDSFTDILLLSAGLVTAVPLVYDEHADVSALRDALMALSGNRHFVPTEIVVSATIGAGYRAHENPTAEEVS